MESEGKKVKILHALADSAVLACSFCVIYVGYSARTFHHTSSCNLCIHIHSEPTYQFDNGDYVESEGTGSAIVVNVQQIVSSVQDVHLLLVPLTYDQYIARAATDPTLAAIDVYHGSRPDDAERKSLHAGLNIGNDSFPLSRPCQTRF